MITGARSLDEGDLRSQAPADRRILGSTPTDEAGPAGLDAILARAGPNDAVDGLAEAVDTGGTPVLVAYRHSGTTNWTAGVEVPLPS